MILLMLFSVLAQAGLREPGFDRAPRSLCRRAEMNACIENNRNARQAGLNAIAVIDEKLQLLANDRGALSRSASALENEVRSARVTGEMAQRESGSHASLSSVTGVFPGGPTVEEIFFLRGDSNSWGELHGDDRRARLNTLANSSREKIAELEPFQRNLAIEIAALASAQTNLQQERFQRGQQVDVHEAMCERDCKIKFCRDE